MTSNYDHNMIKSSWTDVGQWRIRTRSALDQAPEDAPVVVLVHGIGMSSRYMRPTITHLAPHYRVYAPDLPGYGDSSKPKEILDIQELTDALIAWMDAMQLERPVLLGNSIGCQIIVDLAVRYPDRLSVAILQGPTVDPEARSWTQQLIRLIADGRHEPPSHIVNTIIDYSKCGVQRFFHTFRMALADPIQDKLPLVQVPAMVVYGTNDPIVPQRWAEEAAQLLPHGELARIPGASHAIVYAFPLELARVTQPFIDRHYRNDRSYH